MEKRGAMAIMRSANSFFSITDVSALLRFRGIKLAAPNLGINVEMFLCQKLGLCILYDLCLILSL